MELPAPWPVAADWRDRAERIGARLRHRDPTIRAVAVAGDYAAGSAWEASVLQIVVFPHTEQARLDQGGIAEEGGYPYAVDRVSTGLLTEIDELIAQEPLAGMLAGLTTLRITDATLRDLLLAFRDRYHSAEGRAARVRRALQGAKVSLDDFAAAGRPVLAVEALQDGVGAAVGAALGDPLERLRLPRRLRAASRLLRVAAMDQTAAEAFAFAQREPQELWQAVTALEALARAHLEARMPEVGPALLPLFERITAPAQRAAAVRAARGDQSGAAWPALTAAAELDRLVERAAPGWRERDDYAQRARAVYGEPNGELLNTLRLQVRGALE